MMSQKISRAEKVKAIFTQFDANGDGGLNRDEMASLVVSVNPRVKFSGEQINAILDEVFRTYGEFINGETGLTLDGLLRTYDDGAGDVNRDFEALGLVWKQTPIEASSSLLSEGKIESDSIKKERIAAWAASPNHGIVYDSTWKTVDDLEILIKRLKNKQMKEGKGRGDNFDGFSDAGWSREFVPYDSEKRFIFEESGKDYAVFVKDLGVLRSRSDCKSREEAFDSHMAIGRILYDHNLLNEALVSFRRACELQPIDVRPLFRLGNVFYSLGRFGEAKEAFQMALEVGESGGNQWSYILPQIHINLGISFEGEGMVLNACEHYREAAILCPTHSRALKLLGSALYGVGEYRAGEKALEEAIFLNPNYADAHCDLGSVLHALGEDEKAIQEFQKAIDLQSGHVDALYNLGGLFMDVGRFQRASEMYTRVLGLRPDHWRAQLNKAVCLWRVEEEDDARRAMKEAFKMTKRVELHDAIIHLKLLQKKKYKTRNGGGVGEEEENFLFVDAEKYKMVSAKTSSREDLANVLEIRAFQKITRLNKCNVDFLKKEINENDVPLSYSSQGKPERTIRKAKLEIILRRLLQFLRAEIFQGSIKAINEKLLALLDSSGSGRVDFGMFCAVLAPICNGSVEKRKRTAFDALLLRSENRGTSHIRKTDAIKYFKSLRTFYITSRVNMEDIEVHGDDDDDSSEISYLEFLNMFDDKNFGFGLMGTLVKLENMDKIRHRHHACALCHYPITGSRFKEMKTNFNLCSNCYSEGKVPKTFKSEQYMFKEYAARSDGSNDACVCFG